MFVVVINWERLVDQESESATTQRQCQEEPESEVFEFNWRERDREGFEHMQAYDTERCETSDWTRYVLIRERYK